MSEKIALITGASRGFGRAVAEALGKSGWHVIALARTVGALEDLDDRISANGGAATLVPLDITDNQGLQRMCLAIHERWGHLDLLVHAAIFTGPLSPVGHIPPSDWKKSLAVNIAATQEIAAMTDPLLRASKSGIAILPDDNRAHQKFFGAYSASKAAQRAIWNAWAAETERQSLRVETFRPDPMPTALRARFFPGEDKSTLAKPAGQAQKLLATFP